MTSFYHPDFKARARALFYDFKAKTKSGQEITMSEFRGKAVLILTDTCEGGLATARDSRRKTQINELSEKYPDDLAILIFPTDQFGNQGNSSGQEMVAPENDNDDFKFNDNVFQFEKIDVNGENELLLFTWLKKTIPTPSDDHVSFVADPAMITWKPVKRTDIAGNYEKFLIRPDGVPIKRYSNNRLPGDFDAYIEYLVTYPIPFNDFYI